MKSGGDAASGVGVDNAKDAAKVRIGDSTPAHLFAELELLLRYDFGENLWQGEGRYRRGNIGHLDSFNLAEFMALLISHS